MEEEGKQGEEKRTRDTWREEERRKGERGGGREGEQGSRNVTKKTES